MSRRESFPALRPNPSIGGLDGGAGIRTRTTFPANTSSTLRFAPMPAELEEVVREQHAEPTEPPRITEPGYRKGCKPGNAGKKYPADPPTDEEVVALMDACPTNRLVGLRNRALIACLRGSGLRIHEALLLKPEAVDFDHGFVVVERGKGGKRRMSGITRGALVELNAWLHVRALAGFTIDQPVFCTVEGSTKGGPLYQAYVRQALRDLAKKAGVTRRVAPHQLRHALAVDMARKHVSIPIVSRQLGHSNIATTATYLVGLSDVEVFEAMEGMDFGGMA